MIGNLNEIYALRVDRLNRLRARYVRGDVLETEFRELLAADGIIDRFSQDAEIRDCQPGLRPISEYVRKVMEEIRP